MKRIVILGAGESGTGAALLAAAKGYDLFVSDFGAIAEKYKKELLAHQIDFEENQHSENRILSADEVIKSPGIPDHAPIVAAIKAKGIPIIDEIEFAFRHTNKKIIAITGTNGKTTTTLLTHHLLVTGGMKAVLAGNVGNSLAVQVMADDAEVYVVETSSFQLDYVGSFRPEIAILLNITPDHLDRYHNDIGNYIHAKFRITENQCPEDHFIYCLDNPILRKEMDQRNINAKKVTFSLSSPAAQAALKDRALHFQLGEESFKIDPSIARIKGPHNHLNMMAAVLAARLAGVSVEKIEEGLKSFQNVPHRLEYVETIREVAFFNDSKATNVDAVKYALQSFQEPLIWIAGGVDKGNDYQLIDVLVKEKVRGMICLGVNNEQLKSAFGDHIKHFRETDDVKLAVKMALEYAQAHDVVLLSPACASFDLFGNYEDRGNQFKAAVRALKEELENNAALI